MKITKVDVYMLDAGEQRWQRKPIICRIHTDEGGDRPGNRLHRRIRNG